MNNEEKRTIVGKILEIRTTGDGDYDYTCNCWESQNVLIITDKGRFAFAGVYSEEKDDGFMKPINIPGNYKQEYPFALRRYSSSEISVVSEYYDTEGRLTDIELNYEDVSLGISWSGDECIYCAVHLMSSLVDENAKSKYLPWDDDERCIRIEFDKED